MQRAGSVAVLVCLALTLPSSPSRGGCREWPPASSYPGNPAFARTTAPSIDNWHAVAAGPAFTLAVGVERTPYDVTPFLVVWAATAEWYEQPPQLAALRLPMTCRHICINGDTAYLTAGTAELVIVDLTDPAAPVLVRTLPLGGPCRGLVLDADRQVLITTEWDAVRFYSTAQPDEPHPVGGVPATGAWSLARDGTTVYVACANSGLRILDVADYRSPHELGSLSLAGNVRDVAAWGGHALLVGPTLGLVTVDVSVPALPTPLYQVPCAGEANQIIVANGYAYVRAERVDSYLPEADNLQLFQVFATRAPRLRGEYFMAPDLGVIAATGDRLLLGRDDELDVCPLQCGPVSATPGPAPVRLELHAARPNPCNPQTTLGFTLPEAALVSLSVYDVAGRLVSDVLSDAPRPAGRHDATWRGRDNDGRAVPSGVYFYRLDAGGATVTRRLVLIR